MKKLIAVIITAAVLMSTLVFTISADTVVSDATWNNIELKPYLNFFGGFVIESEEIFEHGRYQMRGFAVSPDGKYAFCGFLNPAKTSAVNMVNLTNGMVEGYYNYTQTDGSVSYTKGLAVDDRGYLYVGLAYYPNYGTADFAIVDYTREMRQLSVTDIITDGTPGDNTSKKIGVNGIDVQQIGNKYYMYAVVNYDIDRLYRFDVTDPSSPTLDTSFGTNGFVDLAAKYNLTEGNYLDVDTDGSIYIGVVASDKSGMYVLSSDGNTKTAEFICSKGYAVGLYSDYVLVTTQSSPTSVHVLDKTTLTEIKEIACHNDEEFGIANSYVYVTVVDDILYVADQGGGASDFDTIVAVGLTDDAKTLVETRKQAMADALAATKVTETNEQTDEQTSEPTNTATSDTSNSDEPTAAASEEAPTQTPEETPNSVTEPETGCKSAVLSSAAVIVISCAAAVALKKKIS